MIKFDVDSHTYTNDETAEVYISVTTLIGEYKTPFDKDKHSLRVSQREGVPQEMVLEMWAAENKRATDRGTEIHKLMENYILNKDVVEGYEYMYESYDNTVKYNVDRYKSVLCENLLFNHDYKLAGTADLIYDHGDYFTIGDFKTNKKFAFSSAFNDYFKDPLDHLPYCEFNAYALQMSIYAYMYEKISGKKCRKIVVFYMKNDKWTPIHCNYIKGDVERLLAHYRLNIFQ